jgi:hypothetical protein
LVRRGLQSVQSFVGLGVSSPSGVRDVSRFAGLLVVAEELAPAGGTRDVGLALGVREFRGDLAQLPSGLVFEALLQLLADGLDAGVDRGAVLAFDRDGDRKGELVGVDLQTDVLPWLRVAALRGERQREKEEGGEEAHEGRIRGRECRRQSEVNGEGIDKSYGGRGGGGGEERWRRAGWRTELMTDD